MRRPAARAPLCFCVCVCVRARPTKNPVSGLVIKMYYHPTVSREETNSLSVCHRRLILILPFIHSPAPSLQGCAETVDVEKKGRRCFFYSPPLGPHKTHNGGGEKKRAVIANSINCRSTCDARTSGIANKARLTLGVSMRLCQTPHCSGCLHLFRGVLESAAAMPARKSIT